MNDVFLICKGRYSEKFDSPFEAIRAYQAAWSDSDIKHINAYEVLRFLYMIVPEFFTEKDYMELIKERLMRDFEMSGMIPSVPKFEMSYKYMCELFIRQIQMKRVRNNGEWEIDLSAYEDVKEII